MRIRAVILALLLAAPSPGLAQLRDGFGWDSGPGRHSPEHPAEHPPSPLASPPGGAAASRPAAAARGLELRRTLKDVGERVHARQKLRRIERRGRSPREPRTSELEVAAWLRRQERRLDSADRQLDLDSAALGPTDRATLRLECEISRARQRIHLERAAGRVKLGPTRALRRAIGPRF